MLNFSVIRSSTSDSASTQKRLNDLLEKRKEDDSQILPCANGECLEIVRNFCAMHLGVNLRKAFVAAQASDNQESIDTFVYEFCKLFGSHGTLEYVTSHNATKIIFLVSAALEFLTFTDKSGNGNKLEKDVFFKLSDTNLLTLLKADALMFHHIYADLVLLAKARELQKLAHDTKQHYLELKFFLEEVEECPAIVLNQYHPVFPSEPRLYNDSKFNHRELKHNCTASECIQEYLFQSLPEDKTILFSMITKGALSMRDKLCSYASDFYRMAFIGSQTLKLLLFCKHWSQAMTYVSQF